ncbi:MAG TPA: DUF1801 domain-containing protein [Bryobacteraceae bacterium]|nr:DUF1801 domain-containing protein [Bryobacteraceae bacterium]
MKPEDLAAAAVVTESAQDVETYLANVPEPGQSTLRALREMIRAVAPEGTTEEISYGMPTFRYKKGLVGYAAHSKHCGFYPMSPAVVERFENELVKYGTSKGAIRFPLDKPLPQSLVTRIVKARVKEIDARPRVRQN